MSFSFVFNGHAQENIAWETAIYVSPEGDNRGDGTRAQPFNTIQKAMSQLPENGGGVIALLGGSYEETVRIQRRATDQGPAEKLIITAAAGEKVVFQGGTPVTEWEPWEGKKGLYRVKAADRDGMNSQTGYLDVWEAAAKVRYRTQFDPAGVVAYPGSVCLLTDNEILIHTRTGEKPEELSLWRNRLANGITLLRDNVVLQNIHFENYLGGSEARAITVGNNAPSGSQHTGIVIQNCTVENSVRGITMRAVGAQVLNSDFWDVGMGVLSNGIDTIIDRCTVQSAFGPFAISVLNQHARDGFRFYLPASGGKITNSITAGFWAGLYIKTDTGNEETHPFIVENNIFTDGIRAGAISAETAPQPRNRYIGNIMGPDEERINPLQDRALKVATFESNYFYHDSGTSEGTNRAGENPFIGFIEGNLQLKPDAPVPAALRETLSRNNPSRIQWTAPISKFLERQQLAQQQVEKEVEFQMTAAPFSTSSEQGALITARTSIPVQSTLHYRVAGTQEWKEVSGISNTLSRPEIIIGSAPTSSEQKIEDEGVLFALTDGELQKNARYEYFVKFSQKDAVLLETKVESFTTSGGAKEIHVRANSSQENADGSKEHPFSQIQIALDRALPGDTIHLAQGVYTEPALLVHGGKTGMPIIIRGAGDQQTILDGGKEPPVMLELRDTGYVEIRDLQVRWFGNAGISARDTHDVIVERCRFFNTSLRGSETPNGSGIFLSLSPRWTISHSIFAKMEFGIRATRSPEIKLLNNTAFRNMYAGFHLTQSTKGSVITGNSFTFTGNDSIVYNEPDISAFQDLTSDYNHYGAVIRRAATPRPENEFKPAERYGHQGASKAITSATVGGKPNRFSRMSDWVEFSGVDANSIFADPEYVDPLNADFRLLPETPNLLPDGRVIGASPVIKAEDVKPEKN